MDSIGFIFAIFCFIFCISISARVTKMERMLKKLGIGLDKNESLYSILANNIGKSGTITFCNGTSFFGNEKIICKIVDVDEEWILLEEIKKENQQLLNIDSIQSVQF